MLFVRPRQHDRLFKAAPSEACPIRLLPTVEKLPFPGETLTNNIEERAHPGRPIEIGMGHDPEFAGNLGQGRKRPDEIGIAVAEVAGKQRQADPSLGSHELIDEAARPVRDRLDRRDAFDPVGRLDAGSGLFPSDDCVASEICGSGERSAVRFEIAASTVNGPRDICELAAPEVALRGAHGPERDVGLPARETEDTVVDHEFDHNAGVCLPERGEVSCEQAKSEGLGGRNPQPAGEAVVAARQLAVEGEGNCGTFPTNGMARPVIVVPMTRK